MKKNAENNRAKKIKSPMFWLIIAVASAAFAVAGEAYYILGREIVKTENFMAIFSLQISHMLALFAVGIFVFTALGLYFKEIVNILYKYRYLFAITLFLGCVAFEIHGSSIGNWEHYLPGDENLPEQGLLFGMPRPIRSDEWAVNTPMNFAQYNNHSGAFQYFGETLRATSTDSYFLASQPVLDISAIFRPFYIGYLLLSPAKGLSFFWCGRLIAMFMVTFELGMLITKKNKVLSLIMAVLISFAPAVQWWFSAGGLVEMIVFGCLAILIVNAYMNTDSYKKRFLLAIALAICGGSFIMVLYPAWEIPMAYVFLALLVYVVLENKKNFKFQFKKDTPIMLLFMLILGGGVLYVLIKSSATITTTMSTAYPGERFTTGGSGFKEMFQSLGNIIFPFSSRDLKLNVCEMSTFIDFAPMGLILSIIVIIQKKGRDILTNCLFICSMFFTVYMTFGFPPFLAKITMLSSCSSGRVLVVAGFLNIIILIRAASQVKLKFNPILKVIASVLMAALIYFSCRDVYGIYLGQKKMMLVVAISFSAFLMLTYIDKKKIQVAFSIFAICLVGGTGFLINPVQKGADVIFENPLYIDIKEIADESDAKWIVCGSGLPMLNFPIMAGAPTITCTNAYPALERWHKVDPEKNYEDIYNRYAHFDVSIQSDKETYFELIFADNVGLRLNVNDLKTLEVKYILIEGALESFNSESIEFNLLKSVNTYKIYEVNYK